MNFCDNRYISLIQNLSDDDAILQLYDDARFILFIGKFSRLKWSTSPEYTQLRNRIMFKTDFPLRILANPTDVALYLLGRISESTQARQHLVALGLVHAIEQVLVVSPDASRCLWVLHNHLYFVEQVSEQLVAAIVSRLGRTSYAWSCLERIALRGMSTKYLFEPVMPTIVRTFRLLGCSDSSLTRTMAAIAHATNQSDINDLVRRMDYARVTEETLVPLTTSERKSREHLSASRWLRPGESLLMYLSLCSSDNTDVCYIGAANLAIILRAVAPDAFSAPPFESVATRIYAQEASKARAALDFALTGRRTSKDYPVRPYGLLTECVLRLANHGDADVRNMGRVCLETLPRHVLSEVVWSPSLHRFYGASNNQLVLSMLMLCRRGDLLLPAELLIANILPMACNLESDLY